MTVKSTLLMKYKNATQKSLEKKANDFFNSYIRFRDFHENCISCVKPSAKSTRFNCGHFYEKYKYSSLQFDESNANKQCIKCNHFESAGMQIGYIYGERLKEKIGIQEFERLRSQARKKDWHRIELIQVIEKYDLIVTRIRNEIRELSKEHNFDLGAFDKRQIDTHATILCGKLNMKKKQFRDLIFERVVKK